MRQAIRIVERRDGDEITLQARIYALAPGATRATLHRVAVPPGVRSKSGAQRWAEQVRRDIEAGKPPPQTREGRACCEAKARVFDSRHVKRRANPPSCPGSPHCRTLANPRDPSSSILIPRRPSRN